MLGFVFLVGVVLFLYLATRNPSMDPALSSAEAESKLSDAQRKVLEYYSSESSPPDQERAVPPAPGVSGTLAPDQKSAASPVPNGPMTLEELAGMVRSLDQTFRELNVLLRRHLGEELSPEATAGAVTDVIQAEGESVAAQAAEKIAAMSAVLERRDGEAVLWAAEDAESTSPEREASNGEVLHPSADDGVAVSVVEEPDGGGVSPSAESAEITPAPADGEVVPQEQKHGPLEEYAAVEEVEGAAVTDGEAQDIFPDEALVDSGASGQVEGVDEAFDAAETFVPVEPVPPSEFEIKVAGYFQAVKSFILGGNIWVTAGVVMFLLGFAFLAQLGVFPVEFRIAAAALTGMAMVGLGIWLRQKRRMYALILQGGGMAVLYLSSFAAAKLTTILPPAAALAIMTALVIPSVILALLQNAQALALVGFLGGFAAPILLSDGSGNYVALFSSYTILNLGILAICRYRLWRWLNIAGAACTFVIMGSWGLRSYEPHMFWSVEPFLIGFVLIYVGVTLFSVHKEEFSYTEPVDMILACSMPFIAAVFQWGLAREIPHGLSVSAVSFGAFFLALAAAVWKLWGERMRRLAEFYLAHGAVLTNLALPFEVAGNVTACVWAVEGAILFFFASRIGSMRIKAVALGIQAVSMAMFVRDLAGEPDHTLLSSSLISLALLASAWIQRKEPDVVLTSPWSRKPDQSDGDLPLKEGKSLTEILSMGGLVWWFGGLALECHRFAPKPLAMFFAAASASAVLMLFVSRRARLPYLLPASIAIPVATGVISAAGALWADFAVRSDLLVVSDPLYRSLRHNFLSGWEGISWLAFAAAQSVLLWQCRRDLSERVHAVWSGVVAALILVVLTSSARGAIINLDPRPIWDHRFGLSPAWGHLASIAPALTYVTALAFGLDRIGRNKMKVPAEHVTILGSYIPAGLFTVLGLWLVGSFFHRGIPDPLPYIPVLNPLEMQQALCIAIFALWQKTLRSYRQAGLEGKTLVLPLKWLLVAVDGLAFAWLHSIVFRTFFFYGGMEMGRAWEHEAFQVVLTVLWGAWGMAHLILGNRKRIRPLWVAGASLMLADTVKVFLIDLADKDTMFRVISFFVMGAIFLLIGWLAPLPPAAAKEAEADGESENLTEPADHEVFNA